MAGLSGWMYAVNKRDLRILIEAGKGVVFSAVADWVRSLSLTHTHTWTFLRETVPDLETFLNFTHEVRRSNAYEQFPRKKNADPFPKNVNLGTEYFDTAICLHKSTLSYKLTIKRLLCTKKVKSIYVNFLQFYFNLNEIVNRSSLIFKICCHTSMSPLWSKRT